MHRAAPSAAADAMTPSGPTPRWGDTFTDAAEGFLRLSPLLWGPLAAEMVARSAPQPGECVLDACCGSGASALLAGAAVGPAGRVDGVDLASGLLAAARSRAAAAGLHQVAFTQADVATWVVDQPYDLVQCAYGVFFFPDMSAGGDHLVALCRPGGRVVVLTWTEHAMQPFGEILYAAVRRERPELPAVGDRGPAMTIATPSRLTAWLRARGLEQVDVEPVPFTARLDDGGVWDLVEGTGLRALVAPLDAAARARVRERLLTGLAATPGGTRIVMDSLVGRGVRPTGGAV